MPFSSGLFTIQTAAFSPPAGSVIVATVAANYDGAGLPVTTVVSGGGLTWTKAADDADAIATVWYAVVPSPTPGQYVYITLSGEAKDGSVPAGGELFWNDATTSHGLLGWGASGLQLATVAGFNGAPDISGTAEIAQHNFTTLGFVQITGGVTIPAGDAQVGTTYRHTAHGNATMSNPASAFAMQVNLNGTFAAEATIPAAVVAANAAFGWKAVFEITCYSTGAGGSAGVSLTLTAGGANVAADTAYGQSITIAFNTTVANVYALYAEWVTTAGVGATRDNYPERLGP